MAIILKSSFIDVHLTEDELEEHVLDVIKARPSGAERRAAIAYLRQIVHKDRRDIDHYRYLNARAKQILEERERLHTFDIRSVKHTDLFTTATGVDYNALLAANNAEVIADGQTISSDISITGDYASLHGIGEGSAVAGNLVCGCTVNGKLTIDASNILIEGIKFKATVADLKTVTFTGASQNIVFRNCIFDGSLFTDVSDPQYQGSVFFHGPSFSGSFVLENCEIKGYTSWMLADLTTGSATPTVALSTVVIKDCRFLDCKGSFACRGLTATPTESVSIVGNTWEYSALTATSMHPLFWNCFEANNAKEIVCRYNKAVCTRLGGNGVRGFLQVWSQADSHYVLEFEQNTVSGLDYLLQIAANSGFYSPDQKDRRLLIKSEPGKITDVDHGLSLFYPWDETVAGAWNPVDVARFPTPPSTDFADGLANQA